MLLFDFVEVIRDRYKEVYNRVSSQVLKGQTLEVRCNWYKERFKDNVNILKITHLM